MFFSVCVCVCVGGGGGGKVVISLSCLILSGMTLQEKMHTRMYPNISVGGN